MSTRPHPFTLRQLQYALAVLDERSFHRAAQRCHVAQPSLSAQIQVLERGLGVQLFERHKKQVFVTEAGRVVLERARALLLGADDLGAAAASLHDPLHGELRLGVIPTVSPYLLPLASPRLHQSLPALRVLWVEDKTEVLLQQLALGTLDGAILAQGRGLEPFTQHTLLVDPFVLAEAADAGGTEGPADLHDLDGKPVLLLEEGHCFRDQALAACRTADIRELEFRATSLSTLVQMVASGAGLTLLPALAIPTEAARAPLRIRPFRDPPPHRVLVLAWRPSSPRALPLGVVAEQMAAVLQA